MPLAKLDLLAGYGLAFGPLAAVQAIDRAAVALRRCSGSTRPAGAWLVVALAVVNALLGMALGLFVSSAFATTEFQAVQFMPAFVLPAAAALRPVRRRATRWPAGSRRSRTRCR